MKLTRRRALQLGGGIIGAGVLGVGALRFWRRREWTRTYDRSELAAHLREAFAELRPDPAGVEKFVDLYLEHHVPDPGKGHLPHLEQMFLLSTDFFQNGQPPAGPIRFVLLYHPYVSPCYNPLALSAAG